MLFHLIQDKNTDENIKAAMVELILRLYVDREPLCKVYFPIMIKTTSDIRTVDTKKVIRFDPDERLVKLKEHIIEFLSPFAGEIMIEKKSTNEVIKQYVMVARFLVEHGVFNTIEDINSIIDVLVALLNGTTDFTDNEE